MPALLDLSPLRMIRIAVPSLMCLVLGLAPHEDALHAAEPVPAATTSAASADVRLFPPSVQLLGSRARQQLLVTRTLSDGRSLDITRQATYEVADPSIVAIASGGVVTPRGDGQTEILVRVAGQTQPLPAIPVRVAGMSDRTLVDFRTDVIAALGRAGCNQGACHGSPQGKDGFRLSLRGFDPDLDFLTLTKESDSRRTNSFQPDQSLILLKGAGKIPHQGGLRFRPDEHAYRTVRDWIAEGAFDSKFPRSLVALEVTPSIAELHPDAPTRQLVAIARFDDGSWRDVTHEAVFSTANDVSATDPATTVTADGLVTFHRTAEATVLVRYLDQVRSSQLAYVRVDPNYAFRGPAPNNAVDREIFAKQRRLQLNPAPTAGDAVFLRRAYLDLIGGVPSEAEAREFLDSTAADKRTRLIDQLLERDEFAYFWAMKWADVMRGNRTTISPRGVHSLHRYLVASFAADRPFTELARELLTSAGNTLHRPAANFHRIAPTPDEAAESFAQLFLGLRIQCAKCHNHPFESITQHDYYSLAASFARVRSKGKQFGLDDEIIYVDRQGEVQHPLTRKNLEPAAFGRRLKTSRPEDDRRVELADWLTAPDNRWFARSTANRVWAHLMGRGIVDPVDDFRDTNPPSHPELLDELARQFVAGGYRLKPLVRLIATSRTYQTSADGRQPQSPSAGDPARYFTRATIRMLTAEQAVDAISAVVGLPEEFPGYPPGTRAIELAEGAVDNHFLMAFTRPIRDAACDCAREDEPNLNEALHLVNNENLVKRIASPDGRLGKWLAANRPTSDIVESIYLTAVSRRPTDVERQLAERHVSDVGNRTEALQDLLHALVNSNEFLLRH